MATNEWRRMRTWKRYLYAVATGAMLMLAVMLATGHAKADPLSTSVNGHRSDGHYAPTPTKPAQSPAV